jgi:hypothetical protein
MISFLLMRIDTHTSTLRDAIVIPCSWGLSTIKILVRQLNFVANQQIKLYIICKPNKYSSCEEK